VVSKFALTIPAGSLSVLLQEELLIAMPNNQTGENAKLNFFFMRKLCFGSVKVKNISKIVSLKSLYI